MANLTTLLKNTVAEQFGSYVLGLGFKRAGENAEFYSYRRLRETRYDLVEVQFDKHNKPKFILNFGVVPKEGMVDAYGRFMAAESVQIAHLEESGRLYGCPAFMCWFRPLGLFGLRKPEFSVSKSVTRLKDGFRQVERWFEGGEIGPNMRLYNHPENRPGIRKRSMQTRGVWPPDDWADNDEAALRKGEAFLSKE